MLAASLTNVTRGHPRECPSSVWLCHLLENQRKGVPNRSGSAGAEAGCRTQQSVFPHCSILGFPRPARVGTEAVWGAPI